VDLAAIRSRLDELAKAAGKPLASILGALQRDVLERYDTLRETLKQGMLWLRLASSARKGLRKRRS